MAGLVSVISILERPAAELTCVEGMCVALSSLLFWGFGLYVITWLLDFGFVWLNLWVCPSFTLTYLLLYVVANEAA